MAELLKRRWTPQFDPDGLPRRDRRGCDYSAYLPDKLVGCEFMLATDVAADVADAERAILKFDRDALALADTEALARLLLRAESVASSHIEGLEIGARRLLRADAANALGEELRDSTAGEILANIRAMTRAIAAIAAGSDITSDVLLDVHRTLLEGTRLAAHAGTLRTNQNWIGGSSYNPCAASFVPPPPEFVSKLLRDLCNFCNDDAIPAVAQAALAHAQFETIHPFVDGNGRVGRTLVHMIFRRRGLASAVTPPVSLVLATMSNDYVAGLTATRYIGSIGSKRALDGVNGWIGTFAAACTRAVRDAENFERRVAAVQQRWRTRLGPARANSAADLLINKLPGAPIVTVHSAATLIGRGYQSVNDAIDRLVEARILHATHTGRRNRIFEAREIIDAFTALERKLASPSGDTLTAAPARPVPRAPRPR